MNIEELQAYLTRKRIDPNAVCIGGGLPYETEKYCLVDEREFWEVYYSERGVKGGLVQFQYEEDACKYLIDLLERDQSVWLPLVKISCLTPFPRQK